MSESETQTQSPPGFPDRGPAVFAVTTTTLVLSTVFVAARMVSRAGILRRISYDDYFMILAWLLALFLSLSIDFGAKLGLGRHDEDIEPANEAGLRMCEYVFSILYNPALMATKTSVLVFYLRLSKNTNKILRLASWAVLAIVNTAGTILTFINIFQCDPTRAAWDIHVEAVRCIPLLTEFICSAPVNITTDLAILALPIPVLTGMRLPPRQKTILVFTFTLGIFVTIIDVVRIYYLQQAVGYVPTSASSDTRAMFGQSDGFSWNASLSLMWSAVEVNVAIICACIPTLKPLIIRILPAMIVDPNGTFRSTTLTGSTNSTKPGSTEDRRGSSGTMLAGAQPNVAQPPPTLSITPPGEEEISIRDFLSGSPSNATGLASGARDSTISTSVYFGFVNMKRPKSMLKTSVAESFKYCTVVTILFFLWGFSYGLLNTLNNVVADVANMSTVQTVGLTSIYFGAGYFAGPLLVGEWLLRHDEHHRSRRKRGRRDAGDSVGGFKATFIAGLLIYGVGTIMFWPGAVLAAYGGFMVSSFVVGFGLAVLETAANPFLVLCGPPRYGDMRLLLAQGVQAVSSVLSGVLADRVFFVSLEGRGPIASTTLIDVQWTYLAITLLSVLLALFFYYMPLPEVNDAELAELATNLPVDPKQKSIANISLRTWSIALAVFSQWTYVSAQENMSLFFHHFFPSTPASLALSLQNYLLLAHTAFALSRFLAAFLAYLSAKNPSNNYLPTPRTLLLTSVLLSTLFALLTILLPSSKFQNPNLTAIPLILFFFAEGPIWPLTFSLGMRGQGERTKRAAAWLTMGGCGPGVWPFVTWAVLERGRGGIQVAMVPVVVLLAAAGVFPAWAGLVRGGKGLVDLGPRRESGGSANGEDDGVELGTAGVGGGGNDNERRSERKGGGEGELLGSARPRPRPSPREWSTGSRTLDSVHSSSHRDSQQQQQQQHGSGQGQEAWENQVLDTRILQD